MRLSWSRAMRPVSRLWFASTMLSHSFLFLLLAPSRLDKRKPVGKFLKKDIKIFPQRSRRRTFEMLFEFFGRRPRLRGVCRAPSLARELAHGDDAHWNRNRRQA